LQRDKPKNYIGLIDDLLQYYFSGVDVSELSDDEWAEKFAHLAYIRKMEAKPKKL
jgi:hypothetical protein